MLLTGDLLFVGSIGRPDLAGNELLDEQIKNLYNSLYTKLSRFGDYVEIYPAHGEGSLCGAGLSAKPSSTLGYERHTNPYLKLSREEFKKTLERNQPHRPQNFSYIIKTNRQGATIEEELISINTDLGAIKDDIEAANTSTSAAASAASDARAAAEAARSEASGV